MKRTKLDTIEANFIYTKVLLAFNRLDGFSALSIPERNALIDAACEEIIEKANDSKEKIEALKFEVKSYKLTDEEKARYYQPEFYDDDIKKPENFNRLLKEKYSCLITERTSRKGIEFRSK